MIKELNRHRLGLDFHDSLVELQSLVFDRISNPEENAIHL